MVSAYAEEIPGESADASSADTSAGVSGDNANATGEDAIDLQAEIGSTVGISFAPASGTASLSPTTLAGQSAQINVLATVNVQNSGGYTVYLKSNSANLVGQKNSANVILGATTPKTYNNMDVNTWGYHAEEGTTVPEGATYKAVSVSGNGDKVAENTAQRIESDTKNIMLSFAAKINDQKPTDVYQNTVTMSVVSNPLQVTLSDIATMQDMASDICEASAVGDAKQLKDTRDGKFYWVGKLSDGKCWMTQNLDLDLSKSKALTAADTDVEADWAPEFDTATVVNEATILADNTGTRSWSLGDYRITNPDVADNCGSGKASAVECPEQFTAYSTPKSANGEEDAHYILGNHYQWNAATAGTGGTITSGQASSSICPKGWRLPTGNSGGEFATLVTALGGASSANNVTKAPFYGVRGGIVDQDTLYRGAGDEGYYGSSIPNTNGRVDILFFNGSSRISPSGAAYQRNGLSVRCVAR